MTLRLPADEYSCASDLHSGQADRLTPVSVFRSASKKPCREIVRLSLHRGRLSALKDPNTRRVVRACHWKYPEEASVVDNAVVIGYQSSSSRVGAPIQGAIRVTGAYLYLLLGSVGLRGTAYRCATSGKDCNEAEPALVEYLDRLEAGAAFGVYQGTLV